MRVSLSFLRHFTLTLTLVLLAVSGCDNTEEENPSLNIRGQIQAYQYEIVQYESESGSFPQASYVGNIDGRELELTTLGDSVIIFNIGDLDPGVYNLEIPQLQNSVYELTVIETTLNSEPSEVFNGYINELKAISQQEFSGIEMEQLNAAIQAAEEVFKNSSSEEKFSMAATYKVNEPLFGELMYPVPDNTGGRIKGFCESDLCKFKASVVAMVAGITGIAYGVPVVQVIAVPTIIAGYHHAKKYKDAAMDAKIKFVGSSINEMVDGKTKADYTFVLGKTYLLSISSAMRSVNSNDINSDFKYFAQFFEYSSILNETVDKINSVIAFLNDNVIFFDMDLIAYPGSAGEGTQETSPLTEENFSSYQFSIEHPQISSTANFTPEGKVALTLQVNEQAELSYPMQTNLLISYVDEFNDARQFIAVSIEKTQDCNGDPGGDAFIDDCGTCVGGNTGMEPCLKDCNDDWGGSAYWDDCGVCVGGNTGLEACALDCNGENNGNAYIDECGQCVGGSTGIEECQQDCNGDWGGTAFEDACHNCVGGQTGQERCFEDMLVYHPNRNSKIWYIFGVEFDPLYCPYDTVSQYVNRSFHFEEDGRINSQSYNVISGDYQLSGSALEFSYTTRHPVTAPYTYGYEEFTFSGNVVTTQIEGEDVVTLEGALKFREWVDDRDACYSDPEQVVIEDRY